MTQARPNGRRRSWEYPKCPRCHTDVLVEARQGSQGRGFKRYYCWGCETSFDVEDRE